MSYSYDPTMYPELVDSGSLAAALGAAGSGAGPEFTDVDDSTGRAKAVAKRGDRKVAVGVAVRERGFLLTFTDGRTAWARAATPDLAGVTEAAEDWPSGRHPRDLGARWPFVTVDELGLAYQEGNEVEVAWRLVRQAVSEEWSTVVEAAYARPELAAMFPIFSHGVFRMLRSSRFTGYDTPFVCHNGEGFALRYKGRVLAEGDAGQMIDAFLAWLADHPSQ